MTVAGITTFFAFFLPLVNCTALVPDTDVTLYFELFTVTFKGIFGDSFSETPATNCTRKYFVIRVHDGK